MRTCLIFLCLLLPTSSWAQQNESFDYWQYNKAIIWSGVQAFMLCNGVFTSDRPIDQVIEQELAYVRGRAGTTLGDRTIQSMRREKRSLSVMRTSPSLQCEPLIVKD